MESCIYSTPFPRLKTPNMWLDVYEDLGVNCIRFCEEIMEKVEREI